MLDEFGNELENTDSKLDTTMKKVAKVLHISNGKLESSPFPSVYEIMILKKGRLKFIYCSV
jgi:hypothetical protein